MTTLLIKSAAWRYKQGAVGHDAGFQAPSFDDSAWATAPAPFGSLYAIPPLGPEYVFATSWTNDTELTLRRHFTVPAGGVAAATLTWLVDYSGTVYLDGVLISTFAAPPAGTVTLALGALAAGDHLVAIRAYGDAPGHNIIWARVDIPGVGWDVFASEDLNGLPIATLATARGRYVRDELNGLGEGGFSINRHSAEATEAVIKPNNLVRPHIAECGDGYLPGFFIGPAMDPILASQKAGQGGELLTVKGPGLLSYLDRARMTECAYSIAGTIVDTWAELWHATNIPNPAGIFYDPAATTIIRVISETTRRVYTVRQADRVITAVSPVLFAGYAAGLSGDPGDASIYWALEAPWLSGSTAHTKIHKVTKATNVIAATFDLGSAVHLTAIKADATNLWTTNYSTNKIEKRSRTTGAVVTDYTIAYLGVNQTKPSGVSIKGTEIDYWFSGTRRMLRALTSAPTVITGVVSTASIAAFGGEWDTTTGTELYMDSVDLDEYWKFELALAVPACADSSGVFHPEQTSPGALAARVLAEITHVDRPDHPVPDLTYDFDFVNDSNGNAWPARTSTEEFTWRVGDRAFSDVLARLIPAGVVFRMDPDSMILHAYVDALFGVDRTSATFAAGKLRFVPGDGSAGVGNISSDLLRRDNRGAPDTYMTVAGDNGSYGHASVAADYIQEGFMSVTGTSVTAVLDSIAADELARQRLGADALGFEILWGDAADPAAGVLLGKYLPYKHYAPGDLGRLNTGAGEWDFNETDWRVYSIMLTERDGGFRQAPELGSAYKVPPQVTVVGGGTVGGSAGAGSSGSGTATSGITAITATDSHGGSAVGTEVSLDAGSVYQKGAGVIGVVPPAGSGSIVGEENAVPVVAAVSAIDLGHGLEGTDEGDGVFGAAVDESDLDHGLMGNVLADQHHAQNHAPRHSKAGADELYIEAIGTAETDSAKSLHPDGLGGVAFGTDATGGDIIPYYIAAGDSFTVPLYRQGLFADTIEVDGTLVVDGELIEVPDSSTTTIVTGSTTASSTQITLGYPIFGQEGEPGEDGLMGRPGAAGATGATGAPGSGGSGGGGGAAMPLADVHDEDAIDLAIGAIDAQRGISVAEADGSPTGMVDGLIFPADSVTLAGGKATVRQVPYGFIGAKAYNVGFQAITTATETVITLGSELWDTDGFHSTSSNTSRMTIPAGLAGKYLVEAGGLFQPNATGRRYFQIKVNGTAARGSQYEFVQNATAYAGGLVSIVLDLAAGDYVELSVYQASGANLNFGWDSAVQTAQATLSLTKLDAGRVGSGVGARVYNSTTQSVPNATGPVVTFDTEEYDTDGFHSTSSNTSRMTIPAGLGGKYLISGGTYFASSGAGTYRMIAITKNGAAVPPHMRRGVAPADPSLALTVGPLDLVAGDYIEMIAYQDSGGALNIGNAATAEFRSSLSIMRLDTVGQMSAVYGTALQTTAVSLTASGVVLTTTVTLDPGVYFVTGHVRMYSSTSSGSPGEAVLRAAGVEITPNSSDLRSVVNRPQPLFGYFRHGGGSVAIDIYHNYEAGTNVFGITGDPRFNAQLGFHRIGP